MKTIQKIIVTALFLSNLLFPFVRLYSGEIRKEIIRTDEKELKIKIDAAVRTVKVQKGDSDKMITSLVTSEKNEGVAKIKYNIWDGVGTAKLEWESEETVFWKGNRSGIWSIGVTDSVPVSLNANCGIGKSTFDMTGLQVKELRISAGASSTVVIFNQLNKIALEVFEIESGVSKFVGEKLANANFNSMKFEGGLGSYYLDFGGLLEREVDVMIEVGLGSVTVNIPHSTGARIRYDGSVLSNFSVDDNFIRKGDGLYQSRNYSDVKGKINFRIEAGLGSIRVKQN